jgi:transcriptional regulator with XRE-family HTH domain
MSAKQGLGRKAHFVGTKIKSLRKRNQLTLEDLSVRCVQIDAAAGPSVSYLSMIENGKRVPSERLLTIIADIFQKELNWFYDESLDDEAIDPAPVSAAVAGLPLEPGFLFSENLLQLVIPELLSQTGTTGRQFAHLLIRAHQEASQNRFPDIERAADGIGKKRFPLSVDDMLDVAAHLGLKIEWFEQRPANDSGGRDLTLRKAVRSFFDAPNKVYLNKAIERTPARLKYDLANHIAHLVLHGGDGARKRYSLRLAGLRVQLLCRCPARTENAISPVPGQARICDQLWRPRGPDDDIGHAAHVERQPLPALALFRRLPTR